MFLDLNSQFSSWTHYKRLDTLKLGVFLHELLDQQVHDGYPEAESLTLTGFCRDDHVHMSIQVDETLLLNLGRLQEVVGHETLSKGLGHLELQPVLHSLLLGYRRGSRGLSYRDHGLLR